MATGALVWDTVGDRLYEQGVSNVALYTMKDDGTYNPGVAWSGVSAINEKPSGAEPNAFYADNMKFLNVLSNEEFAASIEAYMSPVEFDECDGTAEIADGVTIGQQNRRLFALAYKTLIGSDTVGTNKGYKLHIIYNCLAAPTEKDHATVNDSVEINPMSWEISTTPVNVTGHKPTATVTIDSTTANAIKLAALEKTLFGDTAKEPTLLLPDAIAAAMSTSGGGGGT